LRNDPAPALISDLVQLNCFVTVAEELHFGRAATRLCMTQPPLTRQIQALEHALGVRLFDRTSRSVKLTAAGKVFLVDATRLLNLARQAATTALRTGTGQAGRVTIGFTQMAGFNALPRLVAAAQQALPDIDLVLREMVAVAQLEALESNLIDVGFLWPLPSRIPLEHLPVAREPLVAVLPADHPLAQHARVALQDLNGLPFVMFSPGQGKYLYTLVNGLLASSGITPRYVQHLDHVLTIVCMVRFGLGVSIVPASTAQLGVPGIVFRPLACPDVLTEARMAWRADSENPVLDAFRRFAAAFLADG
jgi:DNA-binding transcriptional LysR family regulator